MTLRHYLVLSGRFEGTHYLRWQRREPVFVWRNVLTKNNGIYDNTALKISKLN